MGPENFVPVRPTSQKLQHFFEVTDSHTDGQTKMNHLSTIREFVRGEEGNSTNPSKFLPLHFVKDDFSTRTQKIQKP